MKELRVFLVNLLLLEKGVSVTGLSDEEFMTLAEEQGYVHTIEGYSVEFNLGSFEIGEYQIRFIQVPSEEKFITSEANVNHWNAKLSNLERTNVTTKGDETIEHFMDKQSGLCFTKHFNISSGWNRIEVESKGSDGFMLAAWTHRSA